MLIVDTKHTLNFCLNGRHFLISFFEVYEKNKKVSIKQTWRAQSTGCHVISNSIYIGIYGYDVCRS